MVTGFLYIGVLFPFLGPFAFHKRLSASFSCAVALHTKHNFAGRLPKTEEMIPLTEMELTTVRSRRRHQNSRLHEVPPSEVALHLIKQKESSSSKASPRVILCLIFQSRSDLCLKRNCTSLSRSVASLIRLRLQAGQNLLGNCRFYFTESVVFPSSRVVLPSSRVVFPLVPIV